MVGTCKFISEIHHLEAEYYYNIYVTFEMRNNKEKLSCVRKPQGNNNNCVLSFPYLEADKLQFIDIQLGKTPIGKS